MKSGITEAEIEAVFVADGGALARELNGSICEGLEKDKATQIVTLVEKLVGEDHPLRSEKFRKWDQVILAVAEKEWMELKDLKSPTTLHFQRTRHAVRWWLERTFPELKPPAGDDPAPPGDAARNASKTSGPGTI
jgi:hypothetical protein